MRKEMGRKYNWNFGIFIPIVLLKKDLQPFEATWVEDLDFLVGKLEHKITRTYLPTM